jgi:hypothetical protein
MSDDVSILSDETLLRICRVSQEDLEAMPALGEELQLARRLIPPPQSRHDGRLEHVVALLASVLGKLPQHDLPIGYNSPSFDIKGWVERDALEQVAKQIVGMAWLDVAPDQVASHVYQAATESIRLGLLDSRDYDAWCPGMSSGSGWRIAVTATPYGIAKARAMGERQGDATAKRPACSPPVRRTAQDPPRARQPKPEADDGRNSNFCRAALENLKRRAEGYSKQYPSLQHMLVLPEGEYLRVPPPPGCHPLGGSSYHVPPAVTFGESKVAAALPPEDCWLPDLEPIRAVVAEQEFSPYRPLAQKPYRIHLFFGEPAGMAALQSLAADLVNLSSDVGRAIFRSQMLDTVFFHSPDCLHGKDAEILDAWLCTVHWWAWKAVDSPIHTQPRVVFGGSAIPADRRDHAVDEKLSFSVLGCDVFTATVATIDLFFRFFKQPPDLVWPADYPPEPRPEESAAAGNGERATSDSRERPQTAVAASTLPVAQAPGTPAQELADPSNAASAPLAETPASNPSVQRPTQNSPWALQPRPEAGNDQAQVKAATPESAPKDLISRKTRIEFREFLVGWTIREISDEFDAADVRRDTSFVPDVSGARRSLVEQYYHTLNFTSPVDVGKLVQAFENILVSALNKAANLESGNYGDPSQAERLRQAVRGLCSWLEKDGFRFEGGRIIPISASAKKVIDEPVERTISEVTRRNIFDALRINNRQWAGRLSETEFLARLYDLDSMPSTDHRFRNAASDITQHRVLNPDDWPDDWVYSDSRFDLTNGPDDLFLRFLSEMVHPLVRPDDHDVEALLAIFNPDLAADGWEITKCREVSGKPVFGPRRIHRGAGVISKPTGRSSGGVAVNTADCGVALNTQNHGVVVNTGRGGAAVSMGDYGIAVSTGGGSIVPGGGGETTADAGCWVFEDLPDGEVRARNRRLCERYAALNLEDLLLLCHQWRQMAIRFTEATKKAGKYHGHVVHDEKVQDVTKILETALVSRQMDGADRLSRCLRRPDDGHLHYALAALDVLEAKLRVETCESGVLERTVDVDVESAGSDSQQTETLEVQAPPTECYAELDAPTADKGMLRILFTKPGPGRPTEAGTRIVEKQQLAILLAGLKAANRRRREAEDESSAGRLPEERKVALEWSQDSLQQQVNGNGGAKRGAMARVRRLVRFQNGVGLVTGQDKGTKAWMSTVPFRLRVTDDV